MQEPGEESADARGHQVQEDALPPERPHTMLGLANTALAIAMEEEDLDQVVQKVLDQAISLGAKEAAFFLVDEKRRVLRFVASSSPLEPEIREYVDGISVDDPDRLLSRVVRTRQVYFANEGELSRDATQQLVSFMKGRGTLVLAPLLSRGRCVGLLGWTLVEKEYFSERDREEVGRIAGILGVALDGRLIWERLRKEVRERRMAEAEARESQAFLRRVIENAPIGVILTRQSGTLEFNEAAKALLALPAPCTQDHCNLGSRICREDGEPLQEDELQAWLRGEGPAGLESFTIERPDGTQAYIVRRVAPLLDDDGHPLGAIAILQDVGPMREADRLRNQWTSLIVHDLRQPLTVISTTAGLLTRQLTDPAKRKKVESIVASTRGLARMIDDLTEASRLHSRELKIECVPLDPAAFVRELAERFESEADGRPVLLDLQPALPPIQADPLRLEQVIWNLLSNAEKYGTPGTLVRFRVSRGGMELRFAVENEGPPIDPADLPRLFNRFFRAERTQSPKVGGFGLGLYIAKGLVEAHGGHIWAESKGSLNTFTFTLPLPTRL